MMLTAVVGFTVGAAEHLIDARDGVIVSDPTGDFIIGSDHGSGYGITLEDSSVITINSLSHNRVACEAVVRLAVGQLLQFSSLAVANATLDFYGVESYGVGSVGADSDELFFDVADDAVVKLYSPISSDSVLLYKRGGGKVIAYEPFKATVTNVAGVVYFDIGRNDQGFLGFSATTGFVFAADCNSIRQSQLVVDSQQNGGRGVKGELASCQESDAVEINDLIIGGSNDVQIASGLTLYQSEVSVAPGDFTEAVPECAVVGSNSVGILRINGKLLSKLAIADGTAANSKGAVYVDREGVVTNYSAVTREPLLGRNGYAHLDIAGEYVAFGGWIGAVAGQLSLNISGAFIHPDSDIRGGGFSLGGEDALVSVVVDGGRFDSADVKADVTLPYDDGAAAVGLAAVNDGVIDFGTNTFSVSDQVSVSLSAGGTLSASSFAVTSPSVIQLDGGYLNPTWGGMPFTGAIYAHSGGFGLDVPADKVSSIDESNKPTVAPGKGVDSIELGTEVAGKKFIGPPIVVISGNDGYGNGAMATPLLDDGKVTNIWVTGRGVDYRHGATAKLVYGTDEFALGEVITSNNSMGPLLKRGAGTLEVGTSCNMDGLKIYGGTVKALVDNIVDETGLIHVADGAAFDANNTSQRFASYSGAGRILNGPIYVTALVVDMERAKAGDVDTLDLSQVKLADGAGIKLVNIHDLDRVAGRYVIYRLNGDMPESVPPISEESYAAGLSRGWKIKIEGNEFVLRYIGGSIFIFY